jgi:hypothetical protein
MKPIKKWFIGQIIFLSVPCIVLAQQDSSNIRQKILESEESEQILIQKTRSFILNTIKTGKLNEALEAYTYLINQYENESVKPFWTIEKYLLGYWFGTYEIIYLADSLEDSMAFKRKEHSYSEREYIYPQRDKLALELRNLSYDRRTQLLQRVDSIVSDKEKHDYLVLFFDWLTFNATKSEMNGKKEMEYLEKDLTPHAEEFLSLYKDTRFRPFVQRHFRHVYGLNDWGYGYYLGVGSLSPQSTAGQYLKPEFMLGMGFDVSWKKVLIDLGFDIGIPVAIRKPFVYAGRDWNTDVRHNYYTFYLNSGWVLEETQMFKFSPHIGIGGIHMSVCEADKDKVGGELSMTQTVLQYGATCDIKLSVSDSYYKENIHSYTGIRIGLDYFQFLGNNPIMSGGMLRFRILWISFGRSIVRDL